MLSKEEKLKYGEMLRQQMKEKQERKKMEDHAKRQNYNVPKSQSDRVLAADPGVFDPKIILQQKLQAQDYNPFGKAGGGAPNKKPYPGEHNLSGVMLSSPQDQHFPKMHPTQPQYYPEVYPQQAVDPRFNGSNPARKEMAVNPQLHPSAYQQSFQKSGNEYLGRQSYPQEFAQKQVFSPQISKPLDPRMVPQQKYYQPAQEMLHPFAPPQRVQQQQFNQKQYTDLAPRTYQHMQQPTYNDMYRQQYPQTRPNMIPQPVQMPGMRIKTMENEQMQEMYKRGGRNLLKLQNQTTNEHLVKQKQKQEMKNFLKQQMEEAEHKKQEEKEKIKREELQEERRNREYIEMQNQKLRDQQRKKNQDKQKIVEQNLRNLAKRRQLEQEAKDKLERERLQQERRMNNQNQRVRERQRPKQQYITIRQERASREDTPSSLSSSTSEAAGTKNNFNTQISREFVRKQKLKERGRNQHDKKLDLFTNQIQKMRDQISNQGDMFKKQMDKIKREAENAQDQKKKAELQIQRLKLELDKKNKETELRLLEALKRNDPYSQIPQKVQPAMPYHPPLPQKQYQQYQQGFDSLNQLRHQNELDDRVPYGIPTKAPSYSAKPMAKTNKIYQQNPIYEQRPSDSRQKFKWQEDFKIQQSNIGTLEADSMKIPLNLPQKNTKLTMSNIQNYGKQTFMFGKPPPLPQQHQQRQISRQSKRNEKQSAMDQLDRLVEHKWQMSTVKDDITHEIEQLLKKKEGRSAPSQMQSAAMRGLSRVAIPYQGPGLNTLNSNKVSLVSNGDTVDVDKIHDRNQARLRQLRALGVQSINTTNDDDMNRLNALLNSYR